MKKKYVVPALLAVLTAAVAYVYLNRPAKTYDDSAADFSISDTARVSKIFIADTEGNTILLKRENGSWTLNDSLVPKTRSVNLLLQVMKDIKIKAPVGKAAHENVLKRLTSSHKKVEIYLDGGELVKTWYVGSSTQDHFGTYMLLETPGKGKHDELFITDLPWHRGFITPMFHTVLSDWRNTVIFQYPALDFSSATVSNLREPQESFRIERDAAGEWTLKTISGGSVGSYDTLLVQDYVRGFMDMHYEITDKYLTPAQRDSVISSRPIFEISVTEKNGRRNTIELFNKAADIRKNDPLDETIEGDIDVNRAYGLINKKEFVLVQYYNFGRLLVRLSDFTGKLPAGAKAAKTSPAH